jgi:hypothetical protein
MDRFSERTGAESFQEPVYLRETLFGGTSISIPIDA